MTNVYTNIKPQLLPVYDRLIQMAEYNKSVDNPLHVDVNVTSELVNLVVSFKWRPLINDKFIDTFRQWNTNNSIIRPNLIVMGIAYNRPMTPN